MENKKLLAHISHQRSVKDVLPVCTKLAPKGRCSAKRTNEPHVPSCDPPYWVDMASPCSWYMCSSTRTESAVKSNCSEMAGGQRQREDTRNIRVLARRKDAELYISLALILYGNKITSTRCALSTPLARRGSRGREAAVCV